MKKNCIVSIGNIYLAPYLKQYTNLMEGKYDLLYWDREGLFETLTDKNATIFRYGGKITSTFSKIKLYLGFRHFVKKTLKKEKYECVIFLQTIGAIITGKFLIRKYNRKYIIDIRDYSYEGNKIIYSIEKKLIEHACECVISSEGYKAFLPKKDYVITHNIRQLDIEHIKKIRERPKERKKLNIAFIGYINYIEQQKKLLLNLKNDSRFLLSFIGTRAYELKEFCLENKIENVVLVDRFDSKDILNFYENVDLINNLYGNHTPTLDYALSNKLYFAADLNIPILTCKDTFMSHISSEYKFGTCVDVDDDKLGDQIWEYYNNISWYDFSTNCDAFMKKVYEEQNVFIDKIKRLLK